MREWNDGGEAEVVRQHAGAVGASGRGELCNAAAHVLDRNDAGELNLNRTCVLGCGMGANVALVWAYHDWATPPLPVRKQGQDVHAMVLISPRWNYRGLGLVEAMKFPPLLQRVSVYLAYGAGDASAGVSDPPPTSSGSGVGMMITSPTEIRFGSSIVSSLAASSSSREIPLSAAIADSVSPSWIV